MSSSNPIPATRERLSTFQLEQNTTGKYDRNPFKYGVRCKSAEFGEKLASTGCAVVVSREQTTDFAGLPGIESILLSIYSVLIQTVENQTTTIQ